MTPYLEEENQSQRLFRLVLNMTLDPLNVTRQIQKTHMTPHQFFNTPTVRINRNWSLNFDSLNNLFLL